MATMKKKKSTENYFIVGGTFTFFGALMILYLRLIIPFIPTQLYKILPYLVTVIVLVISSMRNNKEKQPPASLGLPYFREDR